MTDTRSAKMRSTSDKPVPVELYKNPLQNPLFSDFAEDFCLHGIPDEKSEKFL